MHSGSPRFRGKQFAEEEREGENKKFVFCLMAIDVRSHFEMRDIFSSGDTSSPRLVKLLRASRVVNFLVRTPLAVALCSHACSSKRREKERERVEHGDLR